jgi:N-acetylmuramic acid 6-phosphate etherase
MSAQQIVQLMNEEEAGVLRALEAASEALATVIDRAAKAFKKGGRIIYVGAGTSGRVAVMDAAEMPPTFGVPAERFIAVIPGGLDAMIRAVEVAEDDEIAGINAMNDLKLTRDDVVIGLAASGRTPFVIAAIRHAKQKGVWTCGIANNRNSPLLEEADFDVLLDTGPEILTGSTRLKAGTAQKLALNRISTGAMILNGKVIENLMVDVKATNQKLKERCARIVCELTTATFDEAWTLLDKNGWNIRDAVKTVKATGV